MCSSNIFHYCLYIIYSMSALYVCLPVSQGNRNEGSDPGKQETQGSADIQENVLLHHAGGHAAATPHST